MIDACFIQYLIDLFGYLVFRRSYCVYRITSSCESYQIKVSAQDELVGVSSHAPGILSNGSTDPSTFNAACLQVWNQLFSSSTSPGTPPCSRVRTASGFGEADLHILYRMRVASTSYSIITIVTGNRELCLCIYLFLLDTIHDHAP